MKLNKGIYYDGINDYGYHVFWALILDINGNYFQRFRVMGNKHYAFYSANKYYSEFKIDKN